MQHLLPTPHAAARILIIDDNPSIHRDFDLVLLEDPSDAELEADERHLYGDADELPLVKPAYTLDHALSGLEGVEKVQHALAHQRPYQMAFVDIRMPGIDGIETIQRIWQHDPLLQVVICTAFSDYSWEDLLRRWSHTDSLLVLKKPFDNVEVMLLASTLTRKWFLARQAALKQEEMEHLVARRTQQLLELQQKTPPTTALSSQVPAPNPPPIAHSLPLTALEPGSVPTEELPLVLIVESDSKTSAQISHNITGACRVLEAHDAKDALEQAQQSVPDIVITALTLTGPEDGLGLTRALKQAELTSHIPIIMLAAEPRQEWHTHALKAGADHCFAKPLNLAHIKARIEELLKARSKAHLVASLKKTPQTPAHAANTADAQFLQRAIDTIDRHLSDFEFDVEALAKKVAVSRRQLFRKLKAVTGRTPNALIRQMRLERAAQLLKESQMTVTEITYAVGFVDLKHFRSLFMEHFGVLPGEYAHRKNP